MWKVGRTKLPASFQRLKRRSCKLAHGHRLSAYGSDNGGHAAPACVSTSSCPDEVKARSHNATASSFYLPVRYFFFFFCFSIFSTFPLVSPVTRIRGIQEECGHSFSRLSETWLQPLKKKNAAHQAFGITSVKRVHG